MPGLTTYLNSIKKKSVTSDEIRKALNCYSDREVYGEIENCIKDGILFPVRNSRTNGNRAFPIYDKYHVIVHKDNDELSDTEISEINTLYPLLRKDGYLLKNVRVYRTYRKWFLKLSNYLLNHLFKLSTDGYISKKERSFQIFGDEKILDDTNFLKVLERLDIGEEKLRFFNTPEYCFHDYIPERKDDMTLLICENKDIWFDIRKLMFECGRRELFGTHIDGTIFGGGNQITEKDKFTEYAKFLGASHVTCLYWGDIDRAGFDIYRRFREANKSLDISLFIPGYTHMITLAESADLPDSKDKRVLGNGFLTAASDLPEEVRGRAIGYMEAGKRLPQEIVNYAYLDRQMR